MSPFFVLRSPTAAAAATFLILACSSSSNPASSDSGTSTPDGASPVTSTGLTGCAPLQPGCFTTGSAAYHAPSVTPTCSKPGAPAPGTPDSHCKGAPPQTVAGPACGVTDAGATPDAGEAGAPADVGGPKPGVCGENGPDYGATMYGTEGDDDDCKYHVTYDVTPLCENDGIYFTVKAVYLSRGGAPLTGACTFAELCLNDTHPAPPADSRLAVAAELTLVALAVLAFRMGVLKPPELHCSIITTSAR